MANGFVYFIGHIANGNGYNNSDDDVLNGHVYLFILLKVSLLFLVFNVFRIVFIYHRNEFCLYRYANQWLIATSLHDVFSLESKKTNCFH